MGRAGRRFLQLAGLALVVAAGGFVYTHWTGAEKGTRKGWGGHGDLRDRPVPVVVEPVHRGELDVYLTGIGTVTPRSTVTVRSRVDGQLMRVAFEEGQMVKAGDLLAEIDPRPFQVQLEQAEGAMARDQALLQSAQADLARYEKAFRDDPRTRGAITEQQLETQKALVKQYEGAIASDRGAVDSAKLQLEYSRIVAPIAGRIGLRNVDAGNIITASDGAGIATIAELQPISVVFTLPSDHAQPVLAKLNASERLPVDIYDKSNRIKLASGRLVAMDNRVDQGTGTIRLKAELPNEDNALFPNQFVNARLLIETLKDAVLVPNAAILRGVQGTYVYVLNDSNVSVRPIRIGESEGDLTAVEDGLQEGERVVVDGMDKLKEGAAATLGGTGRPIGGPPGDRSGGESAGSGAGPKGEWQPSGPPPGGAGTGPGPQEGHRGHRHDS